MPKKIAKGFKSDKVKEAAKNLDKEMKKMKREARRMKWYGNPLLTALSDEDPGVRPYYRGYMNKGEAIQASMGMSIFFLLIGFAEICVALFGGVEIGNSASVNFLISMYWFLAVQMHENARDLYRHEIVQYCEQEAVLRAFKKMSGEKNDELLGEEDD